MLEFKDIVSFALGGTVPQGFFDHLLKNRSSWDDTFEQTLDDLAYELMPELAVWQVSVSDTGQLSEERLSVLDSLI